MYSVQAEKVRSNQRTCETYERPDALRASTDANDVVHLTVYAAGAASFLLSFLLLSLLAGSVSPGTPSYPADSKELSTGKLLIGKGFGSFFLACLWSRSSCWPRDSSSAAAVV